MGRADPRVRQAVHDYGMELFGSRTLSRRRRNLHGRLGGARGLGRALALCVESQRQGRAASGDVSDRLLRHGGRSAVARVGTRDDVSLPARRFGDRRRGGDEGRHQGGFADAGDAADGRRVCGARHDPCGCADGRDPRDACDGLGECGGRQAACRFVPHPADAPHGRAEYGHPVCGRFAQGVARVGRVAAPDAPRAGGDPSGDEGYEGLCAPVGR